MSDAIKIAHQAPKLIEGMLADMFAARADDNRVCMGCVQSGPQHIQIQLVVTSRLDALLDDDSGDDDEHDAIESASPKSGLYMSWLVYRAEFIDTSGCSRTDTDELLALGQGETWLATEIGNWWEECAPLHGLGEVIR